MTQTNFIDLAPTKLSQTNGDNQIIIKDANHWAGGRIETFEVDGQTMSYKTFVDSVQHADLEPHYGVI